MIPYLQDPDATLYHGDCLEVLRELPSSSVQMCATSPPFYGLRDYGIEGQIGKEETPERWVSNLVAVFREVHRVLKDDGTLWIECGDAYGEKNLVGAPWMLAFDLRADGWYLRSEIIWAKPNPMPESVTDRPTRSHSTIFLLSKQPHYYYNGEPIREEYAFKHGRPRDWTQSHGDSNYIINEGAPGQGPQRGLSQAKSLGLGVPQIETLDGSDGEAPRGPDGRRVTAVKGQEGSEQHRDGERWPNPGGANARSVWLLPTEATPFAHFATWPTRLVAKMILAGSPEGGVVLDPFAGSATTMLVARNLGRRSIGIELSEEYLQIAAGRLQQLSLLSEIY